MTFWGIKYSKLNGTLNLDSGFSILRTSNKIGYVYLLGASKAVLNGRQVEKDLCLRPLNQRDVTVTRSLLKKSMRLSLQATG